MLKESNHIVCKNVRLGVAATRVRIERGVAKSVALRACMHVKTARP